MFYFILFFRAIRICDTDSEDNDNIDNNNQIFNNIRGRKLSFNESEDSSTSEFDPGDEIPPKSTIKKGIYIYIYITYITNIIYYMLKL